VPEEIQLGRRALAAGAPPLGTHAVYLGARIMDAHTGLVYIRADDSGELLHKETVPLLSDRSWVGLVLEEAARRGFWACLPTGGDWSVTRPGFSRTGGPGWSRSEALAAMLEATWT
jgi:hypothetical protein